MACFRVNLSAYGETLDESKLLKWAAKFFVKHAWEKPILTGQVQEQDYLVGQLRRLLTNNLKNWGCKSSRRYTTEWVTKISKWEFTQTHAVELAVAQHRLERLASILSPQAAGLRALKANAEPSLAKLELDKAAKSYEDFDREFDNFKKRWGYHGNPTEYALRKGRERELIDAIGSAQKRYDETQPHSKRLRT